MRPLGWYAVYTIKPDQPTDYRSKRSFVQLQSAKRQLLAKSRAEAGLFVEHIQDIRTSRCRLAKSCLLMAVDCA